MVGLREEDTKEGGGGGFVLGRRAFLGGAGGAGITTWRFWRCGPNDIYDSGGADSGL